EDGADAPDPGAPGFQRLSDSGGREIRRFCAEPAAAKGWGRARAAAQDVFARLPNYVHASGFRQGNDPESTSAGRMRSFLGKLGATEGVNATGRFRLTRETGWLWLR